MFKGPFFVTVLFVLLEGCSAPRPQVTEAPLLTLPKQWMATELALAFPACATPRQLSHGELWAFCDGEGAHGVLRRFNERHQLLGTHLIPSIDRLAMADSVSRKSSWVELGEYVYVGTEDGRLLKLNSAGEVKGVRHFESHTWVQHVSLMGEELIVLTARYQAVQVVRLDEELNVRKKVLIGDALHDAEMVVDEGAVIVATDRGILLELTRDLAAKNLWRLSPGAGLGVPRVNGQTIWVGSAEGRLYRVERNGDFVSAVMGTSSITSAPVVTQAGVWIALDEEGSLKLVDAQLEVRRVVQVPLARTLRLFESLSYRGHEVLGVASDRHVMLLSDSGETLWQLKTETIAHHLSTRGKELLWGEWSLAPIEERSPASR